MAPKTSSAGSATKKAAAAPAHGSYKDMIKDAIIALKDRQGSSRQALKKYIQANNSSISGTAATFDSLFNKALRTGVEKGDFNQPKGPSGPVKLAKKEAAPKKAEGAVKKAAPKAKAAGVKKTATKKAAAKPKTEKTATKKAAAPKKAAAAKPKANTATKRKAPAAAPAIVPEKKVLGKTKSGRVTKTIAKPAAASKPKAAKKAAPKKEAKKEESK